MGKADASGSPDDGIPPEAFEAHYAAAALDLDWLERPTRHSFRWKRSGGGWVTSRRRVPNGRALQKQMAGDAPSDLFVGTASWLDPTDLPRLHQRRTPHPILLDHLIVFDIDMRPFCLQRLEQARRAAVRLMDWVEENEDLVFSHATYSGSKGFHLFYRGQDRSLFSIPDPKERELEVRAARKALVERVEAAGHPIDGIVTWDTRRIIRLPGSLHGRTGWACTIITVEQLRSPLRGWVDSLPRHARAAPMPRWVHPPLMWPKVALASTIRSLRLAGSRILNLLRWSGQRPDEKPMREQNEKVHPTAMEIQVSSHVPGTKDRSALVWWLPRGWGDVRETVDRADTMLTELEIGPAAFWQTEDRVLMMVPRAMPRAWLARHMRPYGLGMFGHHLDRWGHSWVNISPRLWDDGTWADDLRPVGRLDGHACTFPWSTAHLELADRMGLGFEAEAGSKSSGSGNLLSAPQGGGVPGHPGCFDAAGSPRPTLRYASIR